MVPGSMGHSMMMRMLFAMMDSDGDGTVSLQEFQAAHERIFKAMDANKDGHLTPVSRPSCTEPGDRFRGNSTANTRPVSATITRSGAALS
jgi:hypothetical protein